MVVNHMTFIKPEWPAPKHVKAYTTLRTGGVSLPPYDDFNLAQHVGDDETQVETNRLRLKQILDLPSEPIWLNQTHSNIVISADPSHMNHEADASFTTKPNMVCAILTADCLPLLICNRLGTEVAAIHAGWRGLAHGIIENTIKELQTPKENLLVWLGPAIGPTVFEVGSEVRDIFLAEDPLAVDAFAPSPQGRWLGDLYALAQLRLKKCGISAIYGGEYCTYTEHERFYSYRREGAKTGRMASLIWFSQPT